MNLEFKKLSDDILDIQYDETVKIFDVVLF